MSYFNKQGNGANILNTTDIVANSISIIENVNGVDTVVDITKLFVPNSNIGSVVAPVANPTFTGNINGVTASMIGLGNVDNTSDLAKPISTATQSALNLKAPLASPAFTGVIQGITKSMVGLGNVDNTSDVNLSLIHI